MILPRNRSCDWELAWDPFNTFGQLQRELNRAFSWWDTECDTPAVNVWSNNNQVVLTAELPGVDPQYLSVTVSDKDLILEGTRQQETEDADVIRHRQERKAGTFRRIVRLPFEVEDDRVEAKYKDGLLRVTLPRKESTKPRIIKVQDA